MSEQAVLDELLEHWMLSTPSLATKSFKLRRLALFVNPLHRVDALKIDDLRSS